MPSVNRQSLREELDTLKGQFERLSATGKVGAEIGALVQALLMLLDLVMAIFMEKTTTKNSNNSGIPPRRLIRTTRHRRRQGPRAKPRKATMNAPTTSVPSRP
jgi:transposase